MIYASILFYDSFWPSFSPAAIVVVAAAAVVVVVVVDLEEREFVAVEEDEAEYLCGLLSIVPWYPGFVGSSRTPDFLDNITTTWRMVGRSLGSD